MSDQSDSSDFEERDHFLRQTFAWRIERPEDLAAVLRLGEILQEWIYETNQFGPNKNEEALSGEFLSAGRDLLLIGAYLRSQADQRFHGSFSERSKRRCERAEHWAEQAEALGKIIVEDVGQDDEDK